MGDCLADYAFNEQVVLLGSSHCQLLQSHKKCVEKVSIHYAYRIHSEPVNIHVQMIEDYLPDCLF